MTRLLRGDWLRGAALVFGFALGTLSHGSHVTTLRLIHPVNWGVRLARLRSLLKIGLFGASFDFASVKLVVSFVYSALPQFDCLLCASYSELHFRQSQKRRERVLRVVLSGRDFLGLGSGFGSVA